MVVSYRTSWFVDTGSGKCDDAVYLEVYHLALMAAIVAYIQIQRAGPDESNATLLIDATVGWFGAQNTFHQDGFSYYRLAPESSYRHQYSVK